jgi:SAM-dependent methyltransferase
MYKSGDFTGLANDYSKHRPNYSSSVLNGLIGLLDKPIKQIDFVDVGAGTGIWTRMVNSAGVKSAVAVEPNSDMRANGLKDCKQTEIQWIEGNSEQTNLNDRSCDWLTMASSFHWSDFDLAIEEFKRLLRPGGHFTALWNPRLIEVNPILVEIEEHLETLKPNIDRVSSGRSGLTDTLSEKLWASSGFDDVVYLEGRHMIPMSKERYIGAWRSVNDLQVQLGSTRFKQFLEFIEHKIQNLDVIEATYLTRAWSARRTD